MSVVLISISLVFHFRGLYFEIVNLPFLDEDVSHLPMVYIFLSLFVFARVCSNVDDFTTKTAELLKQGYIYHKFR